MKELVKWINEERIALIIMGTPIHTSLEVRPRLNKGRIMSWFKNPFRKKKVDTWKLPPPDMKTLIRRADEIINKQKLEQFALRSEAHVTRTKAGYELVRNTLDRNPTQSAQLGEFQWTEELEQRLLAEGYCIKKGQVLLPYITQWKNGYIVTVPKATLVKEWE